MKRKASMMNRRQALAMLGALGSAWTIGCGSGGSGATPDPEASGRGPDGGPLDAGSPDGGAARPNIVVILADQHRSDTIAALGHPVVKTPRLDQLAAASVAFTNCFTVSPLCRPARNSYMLGVYPNDHGILTNDNSLATSSPLLEKSHVKRIRDAGYLTAVIGKTHLHAGGNDGPANQAPTDDLANYASNLEAWGFEYSVELTGPNESATIQSAWSHAIGDDKYRSFIQYIRNWSSTAKGGPIWTTKALDEGSILTKDDDLDTFCAKTASDWIKNNKDPRPFYLQVNFPGPHPPFDAVSSYKNLYDPTNPAFPDGIPNTPPQTVLISGSAGYINLAGMTAAQLHQMQAIYYAKVTMIDECVGTVVDALAARGYLDNTWVIYVSDHGEMLGEHYLGGKLVFFEGATRIPLLVRPPTGTAPSRRTQLCDTLDVVSTVLGIAGLPSGDSRGQSLLPLLTNGSGQGKEVIVSEVGPITKEHWAMARNAQYKLVYDIRRAGATELYDLGADPREEQNRVGDSALADTQASLLASLKSTLRV